MEKKKERKEELTVEMEEKSDLYRIPNSRNGKEMGVLFYFYFTCYFGQEKDDYAHGNLRGWTRPVRVYTMRTP